MADKNDNAQGNESKQDEFDGFSAFTEEPGKGSENESGKDSKSNPDKDDGKASTAKDPSKDGKQSKKSDDTGDDDAKKDDSKDDDDNKDDDAANAGGNRPPRRLERRIGRLTKRAKENGERAERAERELLDARTKLAQYEAQGSKPKSKDFDSDEDFEAALEDWARKQEGKKPPANNRQRPSAEQQETDDSIAELVEDLKDNAKRFDDFEKLVFNEKTKITPDMALAMTDSEDPAEIAYYLGSNRDEAKRIAGLTPRLQAKEIGKLEAKLAAKREGSAAKDPDKSGEDDGNALKKQSKAPRPIDPVKGSDSSKKDINDMSFDEFEREMDSKGKGKIIDNW